MEIRARDAAVAVAGRYGVDATAPAVLSNGANVLVHLAPAPVVARVGTLTALVRPAIRESFAREIAVATYLRDEGAPVVAPADDLPPGPHTEAGLTISFWQYVPPVADPPTITADVFGHMLRELHEILRGYTGSLGPLGDAGPPLGDIPAYLDRAATGETPLPGGDIDALRDEFARLLPVPVDGSEQALHGDAHPGNLVAGSAGYRWGDFEEACRGPLGWDLATAARTRRLDGAAALLAYGEVPDLTRFHALRELHGLVWWLLLAAADPKHRAIAEDRLEAWRARRHTAV